MKQQYGKGLHKDLQESCRRKTQPQKLIIPKPSSVTRLPSPPRLPPNMGLREESQSWENKRVSTLLGGSRNPTQLQLQEGWRTLSSLMMDKMQQQGDQIVDVQKAKYGFTTISPSLG